MATTHNEKLEELKEKLTTMHHDLSDWLDGIDVIFDEFVELENFADKELHTHLAEYADKKARDLADKETNE